MEFLLMYLFVFGLFKLIVYLKQKYKKKKSDSDYDSKDIN